MNVNDPYLQKEVEVVERIQNAQDLFTVHFRFTDPQMNKSYSFNPGQFNMLYLYGVGEAAISVVVDPESELFSHTIHAIGKVTRGLSKLQAGDRFGIRGPFGRGWPLESSKGKDIIVLTGGLGCAPTVCAVNYILAHRNLYGHLEIMHGIKSSKDLLFPKCYSNWRTDPQTDMIIATSQEEATQEYGSGFITDYLETLSINPEKTVVIMCGPEIMMRVAVPLLLKREIAEREIYLSLERNMKCGFGHCGHCQMGGLFVCKDGPVFPYTEIKEFFGRAGF
jgi:NAD(P)H-flavin reductase